MAAIIEGLYTSYVDPTGVIDSSGVSFANHPKFLFDAIYHQDTWTWDVRFIDVINSAIVESTNGAAAISSTGNIGWEHWINVSKSADGTNIFYTWTDTDPSFSLDNIIPDVKGRAWNITTNMSTPAKNFTTPDGGLYYFVNTADVVKKEGSLYSVALTFVDLAGDASNSADAAQIHYFANNVTFDESEFTIPAPDSDPTVLGTCVTGITPKDAESFSVSQNYPNPANESTSIKVTLAESANVSVEITNMVGQSVSLINKGRLAVGNHGINLNTADLQSGIYFYTVKVGTQKVTKKMIVN
jgi:hypothetical protein